MAVGYIVLIGRATADAETNGKVGSFTLAVDRGYKKEKKTVTDFIKVKVFDEKLIGWTQNWVKKGKSIIVRGDVRNDNYTDKDGNRHYGDVVFADSINFANGESMNNMTVEGNVVAEPEVRVSAGSETSFVRFRIAVNHGKNRDGEEVTDFFNCYAARKDTGFYERNIHKGTPFSVAGSFETNSWTDREGKKQYRNEINVSHESLGFKQRNEDGSSVSAPSGSFSADADGFLSVPEGIEEELPFT